MATIIALNEEHGPRTFTVDDDIAALLEGVVVRYVMHQGHRPVATIPGDEASPRRRDTLHRIIAAVPWGWAVSFRDGDSTNLRRDNLLIPRLEARDKSRQTANIAKHSRRLLYEQLKAEFEPQGTPTSRHNRAL